MVYVYLFLYHYLSYSSSLFQIPETRHTVPDRVMELHREYVVGDIKERLEALAKHINKVLKVAKKVGKVVIVTNAETGWIELSCQAWLPECYHAVMEGGLYRTLFFFSACGWAQLCFCN